MMGYNEAFDELVKVPFHNLPDFVQFRQEKPEYTKEEYNKFYQNSREELGTGPYDTEAKVLRYCYFQQPLHSAAFKTLAEKRRRTFETNIYSKQGDVLMIDFGCGPMTSCLALAERFALHQLELNAEAEYDNAITPEDIRLRIHYVGIDTETHMITKAKQFASRTDIFGEGFTSDFVSNCSQLDAKVLAKSVSASGTIIFNFSYILGQTGITEDVLKEWVAFINDIRYGNSTASIYLAYLNVGNSMCNQRYTSFKTKLNITSNVPASQQYKYRTTNGFNRSGQLVCELVSLPSK